MDSRSWTWAHGVSSEPHLLPYGKEHLLEAIEVLDEDIMNTLLEVVIYIGYSSSVDSL